MLGDPFGDEVSASVGIVSATGRESAGSLVPGRAMGFRTFIQTDARVHRGNSGGPVLDTAGQVVGVAVATSDHPTEMSFVIPIDRVREVIDALRDNGQVARSWLGVLVKPVTREQADALGLPRPTAALVTEVKAGSPAAPVIAACASATRSRAGASARSTIDRCRGSSRRRRRASRSR